MNTHPVSLLEEAYRYCQWLTYRHYENFPVASFLLPKAKRPYVAAVYAFARSADDFADEGKYGSRALELLNLWRETLYSVHASPPKTLADPSFVVAETGSARTDHINGKEAVRPEVLEGERPIRVLTDHPIFVALADSIKQCKLPPQLLDDLLTAFIMDVTKKRYATWEELMTYCRYSANPVGRLVLNIFGYSDEALQKLSDQICAGLQLANHWQDLSIDLAKDRLYIPEDLMHRHGVTVEDLKKFKEGKFLTGSFKSLMAELVDRAEAMFDRGGSLSSRVSGRLRIELKLTVLGGRTILDRIRSVEYDVFRHRPTLSGAEKIRLLTCALF